MLDVISRPWPWYVAGPLIGLTVPVLLIIGNRNFGISSSLRHLCAACAPAGLPFFTYDWKAERWNLFFVAGVMLGAALATWGLPNPEPFVVAAETRAALEALGVRDFSGVMPRDVFGLEQVLSLKGLAFMGIGGFLVGFGTRWAGGCTSGHTIMGLSSLQWPSLVASIAFMAGGFFGTWVVLPLVFRIVGGE